MGSQNKIRQPARRSRLLMQVSVLSARGIQMGSKTGVVVFPGWHFKMESVVLTFREKLVCSIKYEVCCVVLVSL